MIQQTHLHLSSILGDVFVVPFVFDEVGPPGSNLRIIDTTLFELEAKIRINGKETRIQPPKNKLGPFQANSSEHTHLMSLGA